MAWLAAILQHHYSAAILNLLLVLSLTAVAVKQVYSSCPKKCLCLQGGIVVCQNKYLLEVPHDLPTSTKHVYLGANFIRRIRKNTFKNTKHLKTLEVSSNYLREIEPGAFEHLKNLTTLTLRDNNLPSITRFTFKGLKNLQSLDLSDASPKDGKLCIEDGSFTELENLVSLKLDHNRMVGISNGTLIGLKKLEHLDLSSNDLKLISSTAFDTIRSTSVELDSTIECCCSTSKAMMVVTVTNRQCSRACSDDSTQCRNTVKSSCLLVPSPREVKPRIDYQKRSPQTDTTKASVDNIVPMLPKKTLTYGSRSAIKKNISTFDVQIERHMSYTTHVKRPGVGLTRNEQWSIAITTCLVFVVSVLMFLMAIYCKKKNFSYQMKCCSRSDCVLNQSSNSIVNEINLMNRYFTAPSESHI